MTTDGAVYKQASFFRYLCCFDSVGVACLCLQLGRLRQHLRQHFATGPYNCVVPVVDR